MDETYFDEGLAENFETSTLEITKDLDTNELNNQDSAAAGEPSFLDSPSLRFAGSFLFRRAWSELNLLPEVDTAKKNRENEGQTSRQVPLSKDVSNIPFKHIDIHSFFSDRNEVVDRALKDCQESLINEEENEIVGSWLLTE